MKIACKTVTLITFYMQYCIWSFWRAKQQNPGPAKEGVHRVHVHQHFFGEEIIKIPSNFHFKLSLSHHATSEFSSLRQHVDSLYVSNRDLVFSKKEAMPKQHPKKFSNKSTDLFFTAMLRKHTNCVENFISCILHIHAVWSYEEQRLVVGTGCFLKFEFFWTLLFLNFKKFDTCS